MRHKVILIAIIVLVSCNSTENDSTNKVVLYAHRDAPIGGIWLKLEEHGRFEAGYKRGRSSVGTYHIFNDTLQLTASDSLIPGIDSRLLIKGDNLQYLVSKGSLEITLNELNNK